MAYMNQERKALLAAELKKVMPAGWKYSLAVRNHSTIVLTIQSAPVDILDAIGMRASRVAEGYSHVSEYRLADTFGANVELAEQFAKIFVALNAGNHDRSDVQADHFDVGWYVEIQVGAWNRPFKVAA